MAAPSPQIIGKFATRNQRALAAAVHLSVIPSTLLWQGMGAALLPLLLWLALRTLSPLVDHHARAAANFGLSISLGCALGWMALPYTPFHSLPALGWTLWAMLVIWAGRRCLVGWRAREFGSRRFAWVG